MPTEEKKVADFIPDLRNANRGTERGRAMLEDSLRQYGAGRSILVDREGRVVAGNKILQTAAEIGLEDVVVVQTDGTQMVAVQRMDLDLAKDPRARALAFADNRVGEVDLDWEPEEVFGAHQDGVDLSGLWTDGELEEMFTDIEGNGGAGGAEDPGAQVDRAEELREKWGTEGGQLWEMGRHRLLCGDSTNKEDVERLMGGEKAALCHADPPYGMGKEKDGVKNDNLHAEKLDAFQLAWFKAFRPALLDNSSVYIWGNSEDLWRLWYCSGIQDIERLTLRNEIVWDKGDGGMAVGTEAGRMYQRSERCLFFMLGQQTYSENADNYWEGWEPIRKYLEDSRIAAGWDIPTMKKIVGHSDLSGDHWTSRSQWSFPTREVYEKLQAAAREYDAFKREYDDLKREYDDLKREYYSLRAYFDNAHESMTDVWRFNRVTGEEREGHPTPKNVDMIGRILKTSLVDEGVVLDPFLGSGTTMVAAEQLGRICYGMEISPAYVAVSLERLSQMGLEPTLCK